MNAARLWAIARKEMLHVLRDRRSLLMAIAMPMLLLVLFGYALTLDVDRVPMMVWDQSRSEQSRQIVSRFTGSRYFSLRGYAAGYDEMVRALDRRDILLAVVIPSDFGERLGAGRSARVQVIVDGSDANTATIALGYVDGVVRAYSEAVGMEAIRRTGMRPPATPLDVRPRVWFNESLESRNYIIPGLIAIIMMVIAALLTSLTVAREWERGTMEQLISTPVTGPEMILGKLVPYFAIGMLDVLLAVLMGQYVFHVPLRGSVPLVFVMAAVFLVGTLAMGILVSVVARRQLVATQMAIVLTFLPSFLLSGFMFPVANMPGSVRWVAYLVPAKYFVALLKGIYLKGVGLRVLAPEAALLVAFAAAMVALSIRKFKKKLD